MSPSCGARVGGPGGRWSSGEAWLPESERVLRIRIRGEVPRIRGGSYNRKKRSGRSDGYGQLPLPWPRPAAVVSCSAGVTSILTESSPAPVPPVSPAPHRLARHPNRMDMSLPPPHQLAA